MRSRALLLVSLLAVGCPSKPSEAPVDAGPKGPRELEEKEPNDNLANALPLTESSRVSAQIQTDKADSDFFRLEPAEGKTANVSVTGIPGSDIAVELLDRDGNHVAVFNSGGQGEGERIPNLNLTAPWVLRVYSNTKGVGGAYTLEATIADVRAGLEVEPNNRAADANPLPLGTKVQGILGDKADEDWFRLEVPVPPMPTPPGAPPAPGAPPPAGGEAIPAPGTSSPGQSGAIPDAGTSSPGQSGAIPDSGTSSPGQSGAIPDTGTSPPGQSGAIPDSGTASPSGGAAGTEQPAAPAPLPAVVRLELTGVPDTILQIEISNAAQAVFYSARSREPGDGIQVRNLALRPGETTYYVTVKSGWVGTGKDAKRTANPDVAYSLTITPEENPNQAELEPNDDSAHATPLIGDGTRVGYFAPRGDVDYFVLKYDKPSLVKLDLSGVDRVDSILSIVKPADGGSPKEEVLLRSNDGAVKEGELLTSVAAGPGRDVIVKVEPAPRLVNGKWVRDQENPTEPYRLTLTSTPDDGTQEREPNNTPETAMPLTLGAQIRGWIHPKKDVDLYKLDLTSSPVKVPIKATATGILKVDVALALHRLDEKGKPVLVQTADKAKGDQPETIRYTAEPGVYLLEVRDTKSRESNFVDAYHLSVEQEQ